ncbi:MAG: DUF3662 and FHA domain-containing protein [Chloroflexi bacterium]|nr:DUF3662 and FHA domain-containing protein [Chloroflexota bacterium]
MQALEQFEELVERLLEGSFARLFRSPVHPVELARKLERALESGKRVGVTGLIAPNHFDVRMNAQDFAGLSPAHNLERELAQLISTLSSQRGYKLLGHVVVRVEPDQSLPRQAINVQARIADGVVKSAKEEPEAKWQGTMVLPVERVASRSARSFALIRTDGQEAGRLYRLDRRLITIGRSLENNIVLEDERVSRHHAQLRMIGTQFYVLDLGSTNGTIVNGQRVKEQVIGEGDEISFGGLSLVYRTVSGN